MLAEPAQRVLDAHGVNRITTRATVRAALLRFGRQICDAYGQVQQPEGGDPMSSEILGVSVRCECSCRQERGA